MELESLRRLYNWLRQLFCQHDDVKFRSVEEWDDGIIIDIHAKTWMAPIEITRCKKCGRQTKRRTGPAEYVGWT